MRPVLPEAISGVQGAIRRINNFGTVLLFVSSLLFREKYFIQISFWFVPLAGV